MSDGIRGRAAVLGLGIIGSRAFQRLAEAGWQVSCWNRTPKGLADEVAAAEDAVRGAVIVSFFLKDARAVRSVMEQIAPVLKPGQVVLNHATVDLATTHWLADRCADSGCQFLDAPFTGSKVAADAGQLMYYLGGEAALIGKVEMYLRATSRKWLHCGDVGSATVVKLATNLISACTVQALAEALAITTHHGVSIESFTEAVAENACASSLSSLKLKSVAASDYDPHFSLANMAKDSRYALELAMKADLEIPAIAAVSQRLGELSSRGLGDLDFSALAKPYLELS